MYSTGGGKQTLVLLKWRKQTTEKAASSGTNPRLVNLGQLQEGKEEGKKEAKEDGERGATRVLKDTKSRDKSTRRANDERVEGRNKEG